MRATNEDSLLVDLELKLFAVADGMGGANAGEVASSLALDTMHARVKAASPEDPAVVLREAIEAANDAVIAAASADRAKAEMGTTLTALWVHGDRAIVGHVGDSRLYRVRWGEVAKLTEDHTAVQELIRAGALTEESAAGHPWGHILSRVVGRGDLQVQVLELDLAPGDRFLICSDGFSDSLNDPSWLVAVSTREQGGVASQLVARAVELDGSDNATAVVVALGEAEPRAERQGLWKRLRKSVASLLDER